MFAKGWVLPLLHFRKCFPRWNSSNYRDYVPNGTDTARHVVQTGCHWDPETYDLGIRGGNNAWIRGSRNNIDYLFDRLASTKSVRPKSSFTVKFLGAELALTPDSFARLHRARFRCIKRDSVEYPEWLPAPGAIFFSFPSHHIPPHHIR
jgi:hypothetical protein